MHVCTQVFMYIYFGLRKIFIILYTTQCSFSQGRKRGLPFPLSPPKSARFVILGKDSAHVCFCFYLGFRLLPMQSFVNTLLMQIPANITSISVNGQFGVKSQALVVTSLLYILDILTWYLHTYSYFSQFKFPHEHNIILFNPQHCTPSTPHSSLPGI